MTASSEQWTMEHFHLTISQNAKAVFEIPSDERPIQLNGATLVFCGILKVVVASAAEAECTRAR